jgi:DinB superfamily
MTITGKPARSEAAEYYFTYIDNVGTDDICSYLETQSEETIALLETVTEEGSRHRYAADKWSIREVVGHVNDAERLFAFRALWFARGFETPLPSFDQQVAVAHAGAQMRTWRNHLDEFRVVRAATVAFFRGLPDDAWTRRGIASDHPFSVRALAFVIGGHLAHHTSILRQRYL